MPININELMALSAKEKIELAEELWSSVEEDLPPSAEEIQFAEERYELHKANPDEGFTVSELKKYFSSRHGI